MLAYKNIIVDGGAFVKGNLRTDGENAAGSFGSASFLPNRLDNLPILMYHITDNIFIPR